MINILALPGSLRSASSNKALLRAAAVLAPEGTEITLYEKLGELPHFNPDLEGSEPPSVIDLRCRVRQADGVLIASPEYAHGVTGVMKNALDWLVSSGELANKPVALLNASGRARHAHDSLVETISTMLACVIPESSLVVPLPNNRIDTEGILADKEFSRILQTALANLVRAIQLQH